MDVKFITTTKENLDGLDIVNGQLIYLSDEDGCYYDMGGTRRLASGVHVVSELPTSGNNNMLYVVVGDKTKAYVWDPVSSKYEIVAGDDVVREVTFAQYNKLTPAEKNSGIVYCIKDAEPEAVSIIDDSSASYAKVYSSQKTQNFMNSATTFPNYDSDSITDVISKAMFPYTATADCWVMGCLITNPSSSNADVKLRVTTPSGNTVTVGEYKNLTNTQSGVPFSVPLRKGDILGYLDLTGSTYSIVGSIIPMM